MNKKIGIVPLHDKVLIREVKAQSGKTKSGIYIPESAAPDKETKKGEVIAVGPGKYENGALQKMTVKPGDSVIYMWGDKIMVDGEEYTIVRESEITAVIN